jgi:MFS family permease
VSTVAHTETDSPKPVLGGGLADTAPLAATDQGGDSGRGGDETGETSSTGYGAVLRNRHFLLMWAAQIVSQTAQNVVNFALVVEVERLTHSSTNVSWVIVAFSLPALLLGPSAGVFVDRTSKRAVLLWTNLLRAVLMLAFVLSAQSLEAIYAVTFVASAVSQFFLPAEGALIPLIVRRSEIITATSLFNLTFTGSQIAGFVVFGPTLYKLFGAQALFVAVVVMYAVAALCVAALPRRERVESPLVHAIRRAFNLPDIWGDMLEAGRFLRATPSLGLAIGHLTLATGLLMTIATLGPGFVARVLGLGPEDVGYVLAPAGLGMLASTVALGQFAVNADRRKLAAAGLLGMALSLAALALVRPAFERLLGDAAATGMGALSPLETAAYLGAVALIAVSLGVEFSLVSIPAQAVVAEATEERVRGRVFALLFMLTGAVSAVPTVAVGVLADNLGIIPMLLSLSVVVCGFAAASMRPVRPAVSPRGAAAPPP